MIGFIPVFNIQIYNVLRHRPVQGFVTVPLCRAKKTYKQISFPKGIRNFRVLNSIQPNSLRLAGFYLVRNYANRLLLLTRPCNEFKVNNVYFIKIWERKHLKLPSKFFQYWVVFVIYEFVFEGDFHCFDYPLRLYGPFGFRKVAHG